jgi:hypothetical protein
MSRRQPSGILGMPEATGNTPWIALATSGKVILDAFWSYSQGRNAAYGTHDVAASDSQ